MTFDFKLHETPYSQSGRLSQKHSGPKLVVSGVIDPFPL
jgi:hypothetical protein